MTLRAIRRSVLPLEGKSLQVMVELCAVSIYAIMTSQALLAKSSQMICHIRRIDLLMADGAACQIHHRYFVTMTIKAGERNASRGGLMPLEREAGRTVRKFLHVQNGQRSLQSVMLGVAGVTLPGGALRQHHRMEIIRTGDQVLMANQTTICHALALPDGCVAGGATPTGFGMRINAPQWLRSFLSVERTGVKQDAALRQGNTRDSKQGKQCSN